MASITWVSAVAVFCLAVARANSEASVTQDGLRLTLRFLDQGGEAAEKPRIVCELENLTDSPAPYESRGANCGFSFRLITRGGEVIHPTEAWSDLNMPDEDGFGFTSHARLYRERKLVYEQGLEEIFGADWGRGIAFEAEWHPGASTGPEPYTRGVGLKARVQFEAAKNEPVAELNVPDQDPPDEGAGGAGEAPANGIDRGPGEEEPTQVGKDPGSPAKITAPRNYQILVIALAAAAIIAFLLMWIPRRGK